MLTIKEGDTVYLETNPYSRSTRPVKTVTVKKVNKRYFYIKEYPLKKFDLLTGFEFNPKGKSWVVSLSLENIKERKENDQLRKKIMLLVSDFNIDYRKTELNSIINILKRKS